MLIGYLEQCLAFLPLALGLFFSYQILKVTDLTADGSYVLGAVIFALGLKAGFPPLFSLVMASIAAGFCGVLAALLQSRERLSPLLDVR